MNAHTIIANTPMVNAKHWEFLLNSRSEFASPCGSTYELSPDHIECALLSAEWEEVSHPTVMAGCECFKTPLRGKVGIVPLTALPTDMQVTLRDAHCAGEVEACIPRAKLPSEQAMSDDTYMIAGVADSGDERVIVWTFHPGEPIRPSRLQSEGNNGKVITVGEALTLGFQFAKVEG